MSPETTEAEFVEFVAKASDDELTELMVDPAQRQAILERIFELWCASVNVRKTKRVDSVLRWQIGAAPDIWDMHVSHGTCTATTGPAGLPPDVTVTIDDVSFLRVITRQASGLQLLATGRMGIRGSMSTALRMDGWFD
ncbi:SCP2 sterol-binding domain-containing protein [Nocardia arthritidis]|uniref:SCP2 domain-containing protein n=1 Tax=Nocardia arthritidis TaxID=228602 RepID=A0A6G9Y8V1_9NOCA|nr:SCP2 sterol-binding domain-containing protein [Nocardia arthritidis]QIS09574.1 hypothetical protein F5544_08360 [Nocardia arthritidis]